MDKHAWNNCCYTAALDLVDLKDIWGFGEKIPIHGWAARYYPDNGLSPAAERSWCRLKSRLRKHGVEVAVPMMGRHPVYGGNAAASSDSDGANDGVSSWDVKKGDLTWLLLPSTPANHQAVYSLIDRLDRELLARPEYVWRERARERERKRVKV